MNKSFHVEVCEQGKYDFVIYSVKGENILRYLTDIESTIRMLNDKKTVYNVLFDTLLYSSNSEDRFMEAQCGLDGFNINSFKSIFVPKKDKIRISSLQFFTTHIYFIESSTILNSVQKKIITKGIPI